MLQIRNHLSSFVHPDISSSCNWEIVGTVHFFTHLKNFPFLCVLSCMHTCVGCAQLLSLEVRRGQETRPLELVGCEQSEPNPDCLQEQKLLITSEPSVLVPIYTAIYFCFYSSQSQIQESQNHCGLINLHQCHYADLYSLQKLGVRCRFPSFQNKNSLSKYAFLIKDIISRK